MKTQGCTVKVECVAHSKQELTVDVLYPLKGQAMNMYVFCGPHTRLVPIYRPLEMEGLVSMTENHLQSVLGGTQDGTSLRPRQTHRIPLKYGKAFGFRCEVFSRFWIYYGLGETLQP